MPTTSLRIDRYALAAVLALTAMVFTASAADPVNVPKLTVLLLGTLAVVTTACYRLVRHRVVVLPIGAVAVVAAVLGLALLVSTLVAPARGVAVHGAYGRNSGLLAYGCALILFLSVIRSGRPGVPAVALGLGIGGMFTAAYGMLQKLGIDAVPWNNPFNPIIAAMGNPNFAAAYMGIAAPMAAGGAFWRGWPVGCRIASGFTLLLCLATTALSDAAQGPLAAGAGLWVVAAAVALDLPQQRRRAMLAALTAAAAAAVAVVGVGAALRSGPLSSLFTGISYDARRYYWSAALEMFREHPALGVGMDQFGGFWRTARSEQAVAQLGGASYTDSAHSVPLQMLAQGGLMLGLSYLAFVTLVAVALVLGLRRLQGQERLLLGLVGGAWVAYQVQSLVSIDQIPLIVVHFLTAGCVLVVAGFARQRTLRLPGAATAAPVSPSDARTRRRVAAAAQPKRRTPTTGDLVSLCALGVVVLALAWFAFHPLRANMAVLDGDAALRSGDGDGALLAYETAADLVPSLPYPQVKRAELFASATPPRPALARNAYLEAAERDARDPNTRRAAASHAETLGELDQARRLLQRAVELDPLNVETVTAAATFELRHDGALAARDLLTEVISRLEQVARVPAYAPLWAALGDARAVTGDPAGARTAYGVALALDPENETATRGLAELDG